MTTMSRPVSSRDRFPGQPILTRFPGQSRDPGIPLQTLFAKHFVRAAHATFLCDAVKNLDLDNRFYNFDFIFT